SELTLNQKQPRPPQAPQPRERPRGEKPPGQPDGRPQPRPGQPSNPMRPQPAKPPDHLAAFYVEKPGFTNYYFNELERDRTLKGLAACGDFSKETGTWKLAGVMAADNAAFEFTLADK